MKIHLLFLILLTSQLEMKKHRYELLLGQDISKQKINSNNINSNNDNYYSIPLIDNPKPYHNNYIYFLSFITNDRNKIKDINLKLKSLVNKELYISLTKIYGQPTMILVPDEVVQDTKTKDKKAKVSVRKTIRKAIQGTFDDNPTFIIWRKDDYNIELLMKYEQNLSEITFKKNYKT